MKEPYLKNILQASLGLFSLSAEMSFGNLHPAAFKMAPVPQDQHTAIDISFLESLIARSSVSCQQQQPPVSPFCTPPLAQILLQRCISVRRRPWQECGSLSTPNTVRFCSVTTNVRAQTVFCGDRSPVKTKDRAATANVSSSVARKRTRSSDTQDEDDFDSESNEDETMTDWQLADSDLSATDVDSDWEYESDSSDDDELVFDYDNTQDIDQDYEQSVMARCHSVPPPRTIMAIQSPVFPIFRPIATRTTTQDEVLAARTIQATWRYVLTKQHASTLRDMYAYEQEHSSAMPKIRAKMKTIHQRLNAIRQHRFARPMLPQPPFDDDWL